MIPSIILLGFVLGMRHATDPDHVIAVSTIVSRERKISSAMLIGVIWGVGHSLTILMVGGLIVVFGVVIPPRIGLGMEFSVGLMLIALGIATIGERLWRIARAESHDHRHDATRLESDDGRFGLLLGYPTLRPLVVGVVHGLAGSAAIALLVLAMIPSPSWALIYLVVFGLGTIAGMTLVTAATAVPFVYAAHRLGAMNRSLAVASGMLSLGFGLLLIYRIGIVDGFLTGHP